MRHTPCGYTPPCAGSFDRIRRGVVSAPVNRAEIYGIAAKQKLSTAGLGKPALRMERSCHRRAIDNRPYGVERWYLRMLWVYQPLSHGTAVTAPLTQGSLGANPTNVPPLHRGGVGRRLFRGVAEEVF